MIDLSMHRKRNILVIDNNISAATAQGRTITSLITAMEDLNYTVIAAATFSDGVASILSDASLCCIFLNWGSDDNDVTSHQAAEGLLETLRRRNKTVPVLLMADTPCSDTFSLEVIKRVNEFVWLQEDTAEFIAARAHALIRRYFQSLLPPFTQALFSYTQDNPEYSWAAPGHQGGVAFTKSAVGREFIDYFGENLFRTDTGIERGSLGSLLDHTGPIEASEKYAAHIFGADRSYSVLNGTSGSNRTIMQAVVGENEIALCDRNCHKSIEQGLVMTGAIPVYLQPTRNRYGIIGPIPKSRLEPQQIQQALAKNPLRRLASGDKPVYAVITNSTYDGMCYHAEAAQNLLAQSVDRIHFDEAWYAYARFNPMYRNRYAMRGEPQEFDRDGPTLFATHSTHKLLAALSQASWIHIRQGKKPVEHTAFNESYMLQGTTSPLYAIIAANEVGAAMMADGQGEILTQDVINEAVDFRQALARIHKNYALQGDWFFSPWNPSEVIDETGRKVAFADASRQLLATDPECWTLKPGDTWHGFDELEEGWCMLDPIKVGILAPGMGDGGHLLETGIPAAVLTAYFSEHGIVPSRTTDFMVLCLFSIGITKGKWGTLINVLLAFKRDYDNNTPVERCLPGLIAQTSGRYVHLGLKDLCDEMFNEMKTSQMDSLQARAFGRLPEPKMRPRSAFQKFMAGEARQYPTSELCGKIAAVGVIPYPPGIPIVMPGESFGNADEPWLRYIRSINEWGAKFPGFEKELEGAELIDGVWHIWAFDER